MTLEQCIERFGIDAPNTGVGPGVVMTLLPYLLIVAAIITVFGIYFFSINRRTYRKGSSVVTSLLAAATILVLALGALTLITQRAGAQSVPAECQHLVVNDNDDNNGTDEDDSTGTSPIPVAMQDLTADYCQNHMTTFTGANEDAVLALTDGRGGITQTYRVAKLADGNCWMLDNLKLGSTMAPITLTPADSNVASNFTLPQLNDGTRTLDPSTNPGNDYDTPYAYGPVLGDTGSGITNYGYLYNWSAVTAGETRTSHDESAGNALNSICVAGWRLPTGGTPSSDFGQLDVAFGGTGNAVWSGEPNIAQWQPDGAFRGAFAGYWVGSFYGQGSFGYWWSSSAYPSVADGAFYAYADADGVYPADGAGAGSRYFVIGVRCLLS